MAEPQKSQQLGLMPDAPGASERAPGRPKGAMNKRSRDWQRWIAASGQHPIEFLAEIMRATPDELRAKYQRFKANADGDMVLDSLDAKDCLGLQIKAATDLLPYVEQKLPTAIELDDKSAKRTVLVIGGLTSDQAAGMTNRFGFKLKENQGLIDVTPDKSDGDKSDDDVNALEINDNAT